jgi:hypothetical protein
MWRFYPPEAIKKRKLEQLEVKTCYRVILDLLVYYFYDFFNKDLNIQEFMNHWMLFGYLYLYRKNFPDDVRDKIIKIRETFSEVNLATEHLPIPFTHAIARIHYWDVFETFIEWTKAPKDWNALSLDEECGYLHAPSAQEIAHHGKIHYLNPELAILAYYSHEYCRFYYYLVYKEKVQMGSHFYHVLAKIPFNQKTIFPDAHYPFPIPSDHVMKLIEPITPFKRKFKDYLTLLLEVMDKNCQ